jgi:predicted transcriptional regulator
VGVLGLAVAAGAFIATEASSFHVLSNQGAPGPGGNASGATAERSLALPALIAPHYLPLLGVVIMSLVALVLFTRITRDQVLEHQRRRVIYEHVLARPGTHFRQMRDDLGIATGVLMHHLRTLEREGFIQSFAMAGKRLFFPAGVRPAAKPIRDVIVEEVRKEPGISQAEIARRLNISRMLAHYYVRSLILDGRISTSAIGQRGGLYAGGSPPRIGGAA